MNISLASNIDQVLGFTARLHPQFRFSVAVALTRTAQTARLDLRKKMPEVFDRPTRYALNSVFIVPAKKDTLTATVWLKDTGDAASAEYLKPQVFGGRRAQKRFEKRLEAAGIMPKGWVAVPGKGAQFDRFGNMRSQQIVQVLSVLRAQLDYNQNTTERSAKRAKASGKNRDYFVSGPVVAAKLGNGGRLPFGIYQRLRGKVLSIMKFVPVANYRQRLDFFGVVRSTVDRELPNELRKSWEQAIRTARPPSRLAA
jgi:hypothetical protein